ncbi:hypothetical protein [Pontibacter harenae]|uniref:hypothetical protein n=1 Tax=Pontibacter harenae TaxID=2894083 RepID=UPI001E3A0C6C|nr:hypothetical protein [Pontibacter harenae]MCC9168383.1 hypothetical protein [Pontibacter harenae]
MLSSCTQDSDDDPLSPTDLLVAETWYGDRILVAGLNINLTPGLSEKLALPDISTLTLSFNRNGTYEAFYTENNQPVSSTGQWQLTQNDTRLYIELLGEFEIETLTGSALTLLKTHNDAGTDYPLEILFVQ